MLHKHRNSYSYFLTIPKQNAKSKKLAFVFALLFTTGILSLSAQQIKGDQWIFQVYNEFYHRQPTAAEVNIGLYNQGTGIIMEN